MYSNHPYSKCFHSVVNQLVREPLFKSIPKIGFNLKANLKLAALMLSTLVAANFLWTERIQASTSL